jgi:AcrR family transcriptional regulator
MARRSDHTRDELHRMALQAARRIVAKDGLRGLSTRRVAGAIGYSPGTLYQLFEDLDDLIVHLNAETLDELFEACRDIDLTVGPEAVLEALATRYMRYVKRNPELWSAVFEHHLPDGRALPEWYYERTRKLLGLAATAISPLVDGDRDRLMHEARVLWASLYGIAALASSRKLAKSETADGLVRSLTANYVAGLRARGGGRRPD